MGTNFYLGTANKEIAEKYFGFNYELTDFPAWGYEIHIAKTSCGWLPLFEAHDCFKSIKQLKKLYDTGSFIIYDEYGDIYNWEEFDKRVLKFNGGVKCAMPRIEYKQDPNDKFYDPHAPKYLPISHFDYAYGTHAADYFKDEQGYEFTIHQFS